MLAEVLAHYGLDTNRDWGEQAVNAICHDDNRRSASVNWDQELYNCFTCNWGGDHITVIMHMEGLPYGDAVKFAEETFGGSSRKVRADEDPGGYGLPGRKRNPRKGGRYVPAWKRG